MENKQKSLAPSNEPFFSGLLSVCGMWVAIFAPIIIAILAFVIPFGDAMTRSYILKLIYTLGGKLFLFFMISLPIWYGLQRILQMLNDFNIYPRRGKLLISCLALGWTLHAVYLLFIY